MSKANKHLLKADFAISFKKANAAIVAEYRGLTVTELTDLRVRLREAKAEFRIVKNRVAKVSIREDAPAMLPIVDSLVGPVGVVLIFGDPAAAAKAVLDFEKDKKELFKVTSGVMEGKALSPTHLKAIADLPSREVLLARIVGTIASPSRGLVTVLAGVPRALVTVLAAIRDKKK
jgi:large subunit ribosomal protein L10